MRPLATLVPLAILCALAVYWDLRFGKIPNVLNAAALLTGLLSGLFLRGWRGLLASAAGAAFGLAVLLLPFFLHMVGAGDVKFLAAAGSLVGWKVLWVSFLAGALMAGAVALVMLAREDHPLKRLKRRLVLLLSGVWREPLPGKGAATKGRAMPFALPLALGLLLVVPVTLCAGANVP